MLPDPPPRPSVSSLLPPPMRPPAAPTPIELEPEGTPERSRRGGLALIAGLAALVVVGGIVATILFSGGTSESDETDPSLLDRALDRTVVLDRYTLEVREEVERFAIESRVHVDGDVSLFEILNDSGFSDSMRIGDLVLTLEDGVWRERPPYDVGANDARDELSGALSAVERTGAVEIAREGSLVTYETRCLGNDPANFFADLCRNDDDARLAVTVDRETTTVVKIRYEGRIPVYGNEWEDGYFELELTDDTPPPLEVPDEIDRSGVECLADELGLHEATSAAVTAAIQDMTTAELGDLYTARCDFLSYPPGKDFGVR